MLALVLAEDVVVYLHFVDGRVIDREPAVRHTFLLALDDLLSPFEQVFLGRQVGYNVLVRVKTVQQLLLFLDLSADDGEVEYLDEMGDIHTCVLHDMPVLLIGINSGGIVIFGLHHYVLKRY